MKKKLDYWALLLAGMAALLGLLALFIGEAGTWWWHISGLQARAFGVACLLWALYIIFVMFRNRSRGE